MLNYLVVLPQAQDCRAFLQWCPPVQMLAQATGNPGDGISIELAHQLEQFIGAGR